MKKMRKCLSFLLALCMLLFSTVALAATVDKAKECTVRIYRRVTLDSQLVNVGIESNGKTWVILPDDQVRESIGSAFAVGESGKPVKHFVTNRHVAEHNGQFRAHRIEDGQITSETTWLTFSDPSMYSQEFFVIYDNYENKIPAMVLAFSDRADLAILELNQPTDVRPAAVLRPFEAIGTETIYACGFPGVADYLKSDEAYASYYSSVKDINVTSGVINKVIPHSQTKMGEYLHMSVDIFGGNSGGPVLDEKGRVVGVSTSGISESSTGSEGVNHAVTSNEVIRMLDMNGVKYVSSEDANYLPYVIAGGVILAAVLVMLLLRKRTGKTGGETVPSVNDIVQPVNVETRRIVCEKGALAGRSFPVNGRVSIGGSSSCDVIIPKGTPGVSGKHCIVEFSNGVVSVTDTNSTHGTWIDDRKLQPGTPMVMHRGHRIYLGSKDQVFVLKS